MDKAGQLIPNFENEWVFLLLNFLFLIGLYFLLKYVYLIDENLNKRDATGHSWVGKPWPLYVGLTLGLLGFLYNVFSPHKLEFNLLSWELAEWIIFAVTFSAISGLIYESILHFGIKNGVFRITIYLALMSLYFYAGFISGLLLVTLLAIGILIFFFRYFKNLLILK
ncbi:MAG: hypothetical protein Q8O72_17800 [Bacteroidales bacterium]|nr:hypothetical protein [Bacteroidales bacterium]